MKIPTDAAPNCFIEKKNCYKALKKKKKKQQKKSFMHHIKKLRSKYGVRLLLHTSHNKEADLMSL